MVELTGDELVVSLVEMLVYWLDWLRAEELVAQKVDSLDTK